MKALEDMRRRYLLSRLAIIYGVASIVLLGAGAPWPVGLVCIAAMEVCSYFATARRAGK